MDIGDVRKASKAFTEKPLDSPKFPSSRPPALAKPFMKICLIGCFVEGCGRARLSEVLTVISRGTSARTRIKIWGYKEGSCGFANWNEIVYSLELR